MTLKIITPEELFGKMREGEKLVLLDVRAEEKYNDYHIEGKHIETLNINKNDIFELETSNEKIIDSLPTNEQVIVTCTTGNSATKCANILAEKEYDVVVLEGGITAWKEYLKIKGL
ncbi:rhodanese-related sulfurtransferase [Ureibacillus xyleni]|uniref:Rhodanese-related sulfurtransferase n=1 Tax=Ureibacillus xyleni TaxID=614648 RepID=A0A285TDZ0_9BACL|nr:rhodanese-like domain-containing protein [Ureibacillus xyleni]SOC18036.1 rhodanese-related sulfurtransferase [Ureibacillus xyleni]